MTTDSFRAFCHSLPHVSEDIKWGDNLCFLVGEKIFAITCLNPAVAHRLSFKCTHEKFAELTELDGVIPAPYLARNHWVALEHFHALRDVEIKELVLESYALVRARLPKRIAERLGKPERKRVGKPRK